MKQLYGLWGVPLTLGLHQALTEAKKEHEAYKTVHQYRNPSLQELGLSLADVEARYAHYIKTVRVGISHNPQGKGRMSLQSSPCLALPRHPHTDRLTQPPHPKTDKHPAPVLPVALTRGVSLLSSISSPPSTSPLPPESGGSENEEGDTEDEDSVEAIGVEEKGGANGSGSLLLVKKALKGQMQGNGAAGASASTDSSSSSSAGSSPRMVEVAAADS